MKERAVNDGSVVHVNGSSLEFFFRIREQSVTPAMVKYFQAIARAFPTQVQVYQKNEKRNREIADSTVDPIHDSNNDDDHTLRWLSQMIQYHNDQGAVK